MPDHPYTKFEGTRRWKAVLKALRALEQNEDVELLSAESHVVGYLCKVLAESDAKVRRQSVRDAMKGLKPVGNPRPVTSPRKRKVAAG